MITGNWHFLFKFKSNSRNNRRDKCSCVGISAQDHCHSCHSGGAAHGHSSSCLIFINISRLSGRPRVCIKCPGCQQLSSRKSESWYNLIQFTNPGPPDVAIFTILNTVLLWGTRMNVNISQHPSLNETWKDAWSLSLSCIQGMNADTRDPGQHNFPIQYSLKVAIKFCGCRAVKTTSSLLSVTFVLSLEARLEDGLH